MTRITQTLEDAAPHAALDHPTDRAAAVLQGLPRDDLQLYQDLLVHHDLPFILVRKMTNKRMNRLNTKAKILL